MDKVKPNIPRKSISEIDIKCQQNSRPTRNNCRECFIGIGPLQVDVGRAFPQWSPVADCNSVTLEGIVVADDGPHVSHEDLPINHYTHDFTFKVRPDHTPDNRYINLLSQNQTLIEIEWETGLGASNDDNPLSSLNERGESGGFYSAGHRRRDVIGHWPTVGDRVYIEGLWVWDCENKEHSVTEIHPPRLVVVQRHLPVQIRRRSSDPVEPGIPTFVTKIDIFASGDGGALTNNRINTPQFVKSVPMSERDYSFSVSHIIPRPSSNAQLRWIVEKNNGDTFSGNIEIADSTAPEGLPSVHVVLPWRSQSVPDTAICNQTLYLYWDQGFGVPDNYHLRTFRVTLNRIHVNDSNDFGNDGEYRVFVEVGGNWLFINDLPGDDDILNDGLGDTGGDENWGINRSFIIYVPPGSDFRVHAGGWEADGINDYFGKLLDPYHPCDVNLLRILLESAIHIYISGGEDDSIGEINNYYNESNGFGVGEHYCESSNGSFRLIYRIEELP
ncbi:hypothetical protein [Paenibacillus sp. 1-18]|uniref:hypothetical protein n=1 Tax=Paenibacillus sp. 1-18 TaxID=1333846 RepID=UPI0004BBEA9B|nr:hypothetical protein [Paenibacillus sp. 1-18]